MKKVSVFLILTLVCFLLLDSQFRFNSTSAQDRRTSNPKRLNDNLPNEPRFGTDRALAGTIRRLTNRSSAGLVKQKTADGGVVIDLKGGFQNVVVGRIDADGDDTTACVSSIEEANSFFGKNLETGAVVPSTQFQKDTTAKFAAQAGISSKEYEFYKKLITDAAKRRALLGNAGTISIVNNDAAGEGFNDQTAVSPEGGNNGTTLGDQRLNLFNYAAQIWGAYLDTSVDIKVNAQFDSLTCSSTSGVLGSAGTTSVNGNFANAPLANTWYPSALANKISGSDLNGAGTAEINATFNSDVNNNPGCLNGERFYYGLDNSTPNGTVNLLVVLLHEMGHGLGFQSFVDGSTGQLLAASPDVFTKNIYDRSTGQYWSDMTDSERLASSTNTGNVLWDGPSTKMGSSALTMGRDASNGRVQLFMPSTFEPGSSISHWDTAAAPNLLMEPVINAGLSIDLDLTRQQMRDIGWYRDSDYDLTPDTITNVQPNGGSIQIGQPATIMWTNNGGFNRNVTVELSTDGGATYPMTIASDIPNTGSYTFTVPNIPTSQGRVRVREYDFADLAAVSASDVAIGVVTSAQVSVSGRVLTNDGRGLPRARLTLTTNTGAVFEVVTNYFGYYRFSSIPAGSDYVFTVSDKHYDFPTRIVSVRGDMEGFDFIAIAKNR